VRRGSAAVARLAGALLVLGSASPARGDPAAANAADPAPPNVVFVVSDDHAWTDYGFMGHPRVRTPNLDRLAAEGLAFTRGYVPSSLCSPSLATIVTGLYPHQHGITSNDPPVPAGLPKDEASESGAYRAGRRALAELMARARPLPERLAARGYRSLQTGKWWPGSYASGGFTHGMTLDRPGDRRHGGDGLVIGRETLAPIFDFVTAARREGRPFFVWYAPMLPHEPHDPPARLLAHYEGLASPELARYWAMVEWLDETVGRLLAFLDEADLARNTLVVYLADNGWLPDSGGPGARKRSKGSPHDAGLRTPILLRWPGRIAPGRSGALAGSIDLVPTVLRAAGLPRDPALPGIDLTDAGTVAARGRLFGACFTHHAVDLGDPARSLRWRWVIEGRWKLIAPAAQNEPDAAPELYDLEADPLERSDLAGSHAARVAALRAELDAWWTGAP
jgi:uncharacterized sulfatase